MSLLPVDSANVGGVRLKELTENGRHVIAEYVNWQVLHCVEQLVGA